MKNKVVVVTGASSGIGKACAWYFAKNGSKVILAARSLEKLEIIYKEMISLGCEVLVVKSDVSVESDCKDLISKTITRFNRIDILINNAGISMRATLEEMDLSVIKKVMDVNFYGTVFCTKYALPYLLQSNGSVVGVSSIAGYKGLPGRTAYSASKFAIHGLLESLRLENLKKGLHVLIACPGFTASNIRNTALSKDGMIQKESPRDESKMMTAEMVAEHIYYAVLKRQNSLVLTFNGKLTVLLNKFFPKLVDRLVYNHLKEEPNSPF
ncbi:MAG: short chain dehydrogenase [Flavobacteriales bacterium]|nr:short chain dehydrogenase [Flavobacteriales bacterium]|tara:strand:- start:5168 stop:5971 length:804 start_codon:yes stop_codon:yes gene_type:complete